MGKLAVYFLGASMTFFIGAASVASQTDTNPWYLGVLWYGFIVTGCAPVVAGIWHSVWLAHRRLTPLTIQDDWRCTHWIAEHQVAVIVWMKDQSNAEHFEAVCTAQFGAVVVNIPVAMIGGTYMGKTGMHSGRNGPIMVEFRGFNLVVPSLNRAVITVRLKPIGKWTRVERTRQVQVQEIRR